MRSWIIPMTLLMACSEHSDGMSGLADIGNVEPGLYPGIIKFSDDPILIDVPDNASVGDSITIGLQTYGGGCVTKGETRLDQSTLSVEIAPFDRVIDPGPQGACTHILKTFDHSVVVAFDQTGTANVTIRGREWPANKDFSLDFHIAVR